jgi:hypothetical protein
MFHVLAAVFFALQIQIATSEAKLPGYGELHPDSSLACSSQDNVLVALLMGAFGGLFVCIFPCLYTCSRAQRDFAKDFLDSTSPTVKRTSAVVREKQEHSAFNHESGTHHSSYTLIFEFKRITAMDDGEVTVRASRRVNAEFWHSCKEGWEIEVAYRVGNDREFVLPGDLEVERRGWEDMGKGMLCFFGCFGLLFMLAGAGIAAGSWPMTRCYLGLVPPGVMVMCGVFGSRSVFLPAVRRLSQSRFYVSTEGKETPSEVIGRWLP